MTMCDQKLAQTEFAYTCISDMFELKSLLGMEPDNLLTPKWLQSKNQG